LSRADGVPVRVARPGDAARLVRFNLALARETESRELDPAILGAGVERALADPERGRYFVAEMAGAAVGALLVTTEWSDWRNGWFWWIQSVYVEPRSRGRGVYSALHGHVRDAARSAGDVVGLRLYVERENARAQATYRRLGMTETGYRLYEELFPPGG
jgi:GNAT superfamily N-acetyltransferase